MEGYAVAELAARADAVAPGLGGPVGELVALAAGLAGPGAARMPFDEIGQQVMYALAVSYEQAQPWLQAAAGVCVGE